MLDPTFKDCRGNRHKPDESSASLVGDEVQTTCTVCAAELSARLEPWDAVYDGSRFCAVCEEAEPWCKCATFTPSEAS